MTDLPSPRFWWAGCANGFEDRDTCDVIELDRTERGQLSLRRNRDNIQVAAVDWNALNILISFPALIFLVRFIRVENLP